MPHFTPKSFGMAQTPQNVSPGRLFSGLMRSREINMKKQASQPDRAKELIARALELHKVLRQETSEPPRPRREYSLDGITPGLARQRWPTRRKHPRSAKILA